MFENAEHDDPKPPQITLDALAVLLLLGTLIGWGILFGFGYLAWRLARLVL